MNYKNLFPALGFTLLLFACSKSSNENTTPDDPVLESYHSGNALQVRQLAIYTKNGINSNPTVIQQYVDKHFANQEAKKKFYLNQTTVQNHGITLTLDFLKNNRVRLNGRIMEIASTSDTLMMITEFDSTEVPDRDVSPCGVLKDRVPVFSPLDNCGTGNCNKYRKSYPVIISNDNYFLPILHYGASSWYTEFVNDKDVLVNCESVSQQYPMFNLVKDGIIPFLAEHDTLLIQTAFLPLVNEAK